MWLYTTTLSLALYLLDREQNSRLYRGFQISSAEPSTSLLDAFVQILGLAHHLQVVCTET
jgi:hypothetical protein